MKTKTLYLQIMSVELYITRHYNEERKSMNVFYVLYV